MAHHLPHSLADVLCEAPPLLAMLSPQDWAALSNCGRQLRRLIHSSVIAITVQDVRHTVHVLTGDWPQLAFIKTQPTAQLALIEHWPQDSNFQLTASVVMSKHGQSSSAFVFSSKTRLDQHQRVAAAFSRLQTSDSDCLMIIADDCGEGVVAQIAQLPWPCLTRLTLRIGRLNCASMYQLATASWPRLEHLDLGSNQLDEAAMTALVRCNWPLLTSLDLSSNPSLSSAALTLIPKAADWALLSKLGLTQMKLDSSRTCSIAMLHNRLQHLDLAFTDMDAAALSQLTALPWPRLQDLTLQGNRLTADAIASLVSAEIPNLEHIDLAANQMHAAAARYLGSSNWLKLRSLDLANNHLDDNAMAFLAEGNWQELRSCSLEGNDMSVLGLELLMAGQWPQLDSLTLDTRLSITATWALLDVSSEADCNVEQGLFEAPRVLRVVSTISAEHVVWPKLTHVQFWADQSKWYTMLCW